MFAWTGRSSSVGKARVMRRCRKCRHGDTNCRMSNTVVEVGRMDGWSVEWYGIDPFGGREGASRIFGGRSKRSSITRGRDLQR